MASISSLDYTDNMSANKKPLLTDFRASLDSIETYINTTLKFSVNDLLIDCFPSGYACTTDGTGRFTNSDLYNKLNAKDIYTGGDITISTTGSWLDVDSTNAAISITPDYLTGDFKATFQFNVSSVTTNATNAVLVYFRLTDGSDESDAQATIHHVTGVTATTNIEPVTLSYQFDDWSASLKTVKLQCFVTTLTATTLKVLANSNSPIAMQVEKI